MKRAAVVGLLCSIVIVLLATSVSAHLHVRKWENVLRGVRLDGTATINVSTTVLQTTGSWITVNYQTDVSKADSGDTIYVFSPPNVDFSTKAPVKFKSANVASYLQTGKGVTQFQLVNLRADYVIVYAQGGDVVATSPVITFKNYNEPTQAHLAYTDSPSEVRLKWVTRDRVNPQVKFGVLSGQYQWTATATTATYTAKDLCGAPANSTGWMDPGLIHDAVLTNLKPNQKYYYIYGDSAYSWSSESSFVAAPVPGDNINIIAFGDMGKGEEDGSSCHWDEKPALNTTNNIAKELSELQYNAVFHIGDISYAVGYASQWDKFFETIQPLATQVPWMVCPGNHEADFNSFSWIPVGDSYGECGVPYFSRFNMPNNNKPWYSFNLGPAHFTLMSTEHDFTVGSEQYNYIMKDLAGVDKSVTPWVIFAGHRPMYISSTNRNTPDGDQTVATLLRKHVEPLLLQYHVDMAWWGHHHSYQRSCPVFNETCTPGATVHVVIGMAGMGLSTNIQPTPPSWLQYIDDKEYGYSRLFISRSSLHMQFLISGRAAADTFFSSLPA
jgi:hypothetical protein